MQATARYDGWQQRSGVAPITVNRLEADGGAVVVDASKCYAETQCWIRQVDWTSHDMTVRDRVELKPGQRDILMFRWHLGTDAAVMATDRDGGKACTIVWKDARMIVQADQPLAVKTYLTADFTVTAHQDHQHTCVEVRTLDITNSVQITTTIEPSSQPDGPAVTVGPDGGGRMKMLG